MRTSAETNDLWTAVAAVQQSVDPMPKTATNPFHKSQYTPLPVLWALLATKLKDEGLVVAFGGEDHELDPDRFYLTMRVIHYLSNPSQWVEVVLPIPHKGDPQGLGSAITYGRRYALSAFFGLISEEDDDGERAMREHRDKGRAEALKGKVTPGPVAKAEGRSTQERTQYEMAIGLAGDVQTLTELEKDITANAQLLRGDKDHLTDELMARTIRLAPHLLALEAVGASLKKQKLENGRREYLKGVYLERKAALESVAAQQGEDV